MRACGASPLRARCVATRDRSARPTRVLTSLAASNPDECVRAQERSEKLKKLREEEKAAVKAGGAEATKNRLAYLMKQADIFAHFVGGLEPSKANAAAGSGDASAGSSADGGSSGAGRRGKGRLSEKAEDEMMLKAASDDTQAKTGSEAGTRLLKQPACIAHGAPPPRAAAPPPPRAAPPGGLQPPSGRAHAHWLHGRAVACTRDCVVDAQMVAGGDGPRACSRQPRLPRPPRHRGSRVGCASRIAPLTRCWEVQGRGYRLTRVLASMWARSVGAAGGGRRQDARLSARRPQLDD